MCHSQSKECMEKRRSTALMLDFLCRWEVIQKGSTESHIPQMEKIIRLFFCLFACLWLCIYLPSQVIKKYLKIGSALQP